MPLQMWLLLPGNIWWCKSPHEHSTLGKGRHLVDVAFMLIHLMDFYLEKFKQIKTKQKKLKDKAEKGFKQTTLKQITI